MSVKRKFDLNFAVIQDDGIESPSPRWIGSLIDSPSMMNKKSSPLSGSFQEATLQQERALLPEIGNGGNGVVLHDQGADSMVVEETEFDDHHNDDNNNNIPTRLQTHSHHDYQYPMDSNTFAGIAAHQTYTSIPTSTDTMALWRTGFSSSDMQQSLQHFESNCHSNNNNNSSILQHQDPCSPSVGGPTELGIQLQRVATLSSMYGGRTWHY